MKYFAPVSDIKDLLSCELLRDSTDLGMQFGIRLALGEEQIVIRELTASERRAQRLLERLRRGSVTPVALRDVVDDWLLEESL